MLALSALSVLALASSGIGIGSIGITSHIGSGINAGSVCIGIDVGVGGVVGVVLSWCRGLVIHPASRGSQQWTAESGVLSLL